MPATAAIDRSAVASTRAGELTRHLGLFDATAVTVGSIIGVGAFATTGIIAEVMPHPVMVLALWAVGGLLALSGALTIAELGSAMPASGGEYVYLREAYGSLPAFLNGWTHLTVVGPGSIAALTVAFCSYLDACVPSISLRGPLVPAVSIPGLADITTGHGIMIALVAALSLLHARGVRAGSLVQNGLTLAKAGAILALIVVGLAAGKGSWSHLHVSGIGAISDLKPSGLGAAVAAVFFSYSGWYACAYVAGEVRRPERTIPLSIIGSCALVTVLYVLLNTAYLYALPMDQMCGVLSIGESAARALFGEWSATVVSWVILVTVLGSLNATVLTSPRVSYAMARDGLFLSATARVHPRYGSPATAITIQAVLACLLLLSGGFGLLLTSATVAMLIFSILTGTAVFVLRRSHPEMTRPYRVWGYPWMPALFVVSCTACLGLVVATQPSESVWGLGMVALGVPAYLAWHRRGSHPRGYPRGGHTCTSW